MPQAQIRARLRSCGSEAALLEVARRPKILQVQRVPALAAPVLRAAALIALAIRATVVLIALAITATAILIILAIKALVVVAVKAIPQLVPLLRAYLTGSG